MISLKISIITVSKNSGKYLQETIESVLNQTHKNVEYLIIDGCSTDNSLEIIRNNENRLAYWISEPDLSMYHAINKGLERATGEYILILNSDDMLADPMVLERMVEQFKTDRLDYYYGNMIRVNRNLLKKVALFSVQYKVLLLSKHGTFVPHPCLFISNALNKRLNGYNIKYKYASDYDYILRALSTKGVSGKHIRTYVTKFRIHENSISSSGRIDSERRQILKEHGYGNYCIIVKMVYYYSSWLFYKFINIHHFYSEKCILNH